jgi:hypothetical protein
MLIPHLDDFLEESFGRNSYIVSQISYFKIEGIDLFVKILVFVKICISTRKEDKFQSLEVRETSSSHLKNIGFCVLKLETPQPVLPYARMRILPTNFSGNLRHNKRDC